MVLLYLLTILCFITTCDTVLRNDLKVANIFLKHVIHT